VPVDDQTSNWAYMVMASLAWTMKTWFALLLPEAGRWGEKYANDKDALLRREFKGFVNAFIRLPCQGHSHRAPDRVSVDGLENEPDIGLPPLFFEITQLPCKFVSGFLKSLSFLASSCQVF
jgi:hypothetical protein